MCRKPAIILFMLTGYAWQHAGAQLAGSSPFDAAPVGKQVPGIIECGENYEGNEAYDVKITVAELVRGEKRVRKVLSGIPTPADGKDYVLTRIKFEYIARGRPGNCVHTVKVNHFTALAMSGEVYSRPSLTIPGPELVGPVKTGEIREGWIAFLVATDDPEPLMTFSVDDSGAVQHGGKLWFQLY